MNTINAQYTTSSNYVFANTSSTSPSSMSQRQNTTIGSNSQNPLMSLFTPMDIDDGNNNNDNHQEDEYDSDSSSSLSSSSSGSCSSSSSSSSSSSASSFSASMSSTAAKRKHYTSSSSPNKKSSSSKTKRNKSSTKNTTEDFFERGGGVDDDDDVSNIKSIIPDEITIQLGDMRCESFDLEQLRRTLFTASAVQKDTGVHSKTTQHVFNDMYLMQVEDVEEQLERKQQQEEEEQNQKKQTTSDNKNNESKRNQAFGHSVTSVESTTVGEPSDLQIGSKSATTIPTSESSNFADESTTTTTITANQSKVEYPQFGVNNDQDEDHHNNTEEGSPFPSPFSLQRKNTQAMLSNTNNINNLSSTAAPRQASFLSSKQHASFMKPKTTTPGKKNRKNNRNNNNDEEIVKIGTYNARQELSFEDIVQREFIERSNQKAVLLMNDPISGSTGNGASAISGAQMMFSNIAMKGALDNVGSSSSIPVDNRTRTISQLGRYSGHVALFLKITNHSTGYRTTSRVVDLNLTDAMVAKLCAAGLQLTKHPNVIYPGRHRGVVNLCFFQAHRESKKDRTNTKSAMERKIRRRQERDRSNMRVLEHFEDDDDEAEVDNEKFGGVVDSSTRARKKSLHEEYFISGKRDSVFETDDDNDSIEHEEQDFDDVQKHDPHDFEQATSTTTTTRRNTKRMSLVDSGSLSFSNHQNSSSIYAENTNFNNNDDNKIQKSSTSSSNNHDNINNNKTRNSNNTIHQNHHHQLFTEGLTTVDPLQHHYDKASKGNSSASKQLRFDRGVSRARTMEQIQKESHTMENGLNDHNNDYQNTNNNTNNNDTTNNNNDYTNSTRRSTMISPSQNRKISSWNDDEQKTEEDQKCYDVGVEQSLLTADRQSAVDLARRRRQHQISLLRSGAAGGGTTKTPPPKASHDRHGLLSKFDRKEESGDVMLPSETDRHNFTNIIARTPQPFLSRNNNPSSETTETTRKTKIVVSTKTQGFGEARRLDPSDSDSDDELAAVARGDLPSFSIDLRKQVDEAILAEKKAEFMQFALTAAPPPLQEDFYQQQQHLAVGRGPDGSSSLSVTPPIQQLQHNYSNNNNQRVLNASSIVKDDQEVNSLANTRASLTSQNRQDLFDAMQFAAKFLDASATNSSLTPNPFLTNDSLAAQRTPPVDGLQQQHQLELSNTHNYSNYVSSFMATAGPLNTSTSTQSPGIQNLGVSTTQPQQQQRPRRSSVVATKLEEAKNFFSASGKTRQQLLNEGQSDYVTPLSLADPYYSNKNIETHMCLTRQQSGLSQKTNDSDEPPMMMNMRSGNSKQQSHHQQSTNVSGRSSRRQSLIHSSGVFLHNHHHHHHHPASAPIGHLSHPPAISTSAALATSTHHDFNDDTAPPEFHTTQALPTTTSPTRKRRSEASDLSSNQEQQQQQQQPQQSTSDKNNNTTKQTVGPSSTGGSASLSPPTQSIMGSAMTTSLKRKKDVSFSADVFGSSSSSNQQQQQKPEEIDKSSSMFAISGFEQLKTPSALKPLDTHFSLQYRERTGSSSLTPQSHALSPRSMDDAVGHEEERNNHQYQLPSSAYTSHKATPTSKPVSPSVAFLQQRKRRASLSFGGGGGALRHTQSVLPTNDNNNNNNDDAEDVFANTTKSSGAGSHHSGGGDRRKSLLSPSPTSNNIDYNYLNTSHYDYYNSSNNNNTPNTDGNHQMMNNVVRKSTSVLSAKDWKMRSQLIAATRAENSQRNLPQDMQYGFNQNELNANIVREQQKQLLRKQQKQRRSSPVAGGGDYIHHRSTSQTPYSTTGLDGDVTNIDSNINSSPSGIGSSPKLSESTVRRKKKEIELSHRRAQKAKEKAIRRSRKAIKKAAIRRIRRLLTRLMKLRVELWCGKSLTDPLAVKLGETELDLSSLMKSVAQTLLEQQKKFRKEQELREKKRRQEEMEANIIKKNEDHELDEERRRMKKREEEEDEQFEVFSHHHQFHTVSSQCSAVLGAKAGCGDDATVVCTVTVRGFKNAAAGTASSSSPDRQTQNSNRYHFTKDLQSQRRESGLSNQQDQGEDEEVKGGLLTERKKRLANTWVAPKTKIHIEDASVVECQRKQTEAMIVAWVHHMATNTINQALEPVMRKLDQVERKINRMNIVLNQMGLKKK